MSKKENAPKNINEMTVSELRRVATTLGLDATGSKKELLLALTTWEEKTLAEKEPVVATRTPVMVGSGVADFHNGKRVVSRTLKVLNGKEYEDILVESGETFTELV